jgi:hypothetical protein
MGKGEDMMCKKWGYGTDAERIDVDGYKARKSLRGESRHVAIIPSMHCTPHVCACTHEK